MRYDSMVPRRFTVVMLVAGMASCAPFSGASEIGAGDDASAESGSPSQGTRDAGGSVGPNRDAGAADAGATDASVEAGIDAGAIDAGVDAGPIPEFLCPATGTNVFDCSACAGNPLQCELCGGPSPRKFCTTGRICNASQTLNYWCPCAGGNDASKCPLAKQTCYSGLGSPICLTCGEQNSTAGYACGGGGTCSAASYVCQ